MAINNFDRTSLEEARVLGKYYGIEGYETMNHEDLLNAIDGTQAIDTLFDTNTISGNPKVANLTVTRDLSGNYILTFS